MTNKEALEIITNALQTDESKYTEKIDKALAVAQKALEQEPCEDAISRQKVLSKIKEVCFSKEWVQFRVDNGSNGQRDFLIDYIGQLPSVQPDVPEWVQTVERWYNKALTKSYIKKPLAWALHQTWKEYDYDE